MLFIFLLVCSPISVCGDFSQLFINAENFGSFKVPGGKFATGSHPENNYGRHSIGEVSNKIVGVDIFKSVSEENDSKNYLLNAVRRPDIVTNIIPRKIITSTLALSEHGQLLRLDHNSCEYLRNDEWREAGIILNDAVLVYSHRTVQNGKMESINIVAVLDDANQIRFAYFMNNGTLTVLDDVQNLKNPSILISSLGSGFIWNTDSRGVITKNIVLGMFSKTTGKHQFYKFSSNDGRKVDLKLSFEWDKAGDLFSMMQLHGNIVVIVSNGKNASFYSLRIKSESNDMLISSLQDVALRNDITSIEHFSIHGALYVALSSKKSVQVYRMLLSGVFSVQELRAMGKYNILRTVSLRIREHNTPAAILLITDGGIDLYFWNSVRGQFSQGAQVDDFSDLKLESSIFQHSGNSDFMIVKLRHTNDSLAVIEVLQTIVLQNPDSSKDFLLNNIKRMESVKFEEKEKNRQQRSLIYSVNVNLNGIRSAIKTLHNDLENLHEQFEDLVPREGSTREIEGEKYFFQLANIRTLKIKNALLGTAGKLMVNDIIRDLVSIKEERPIFGTKRFRGNVQISDLRTPFLNNVDTSDFQSSNSTILLGKVRFENGFKVQNDIRLHHDSKIDGLKLSRDIVTLSGRHQLGRCSFKDVISDKGVTVENDFVNGEHIRRFSDAIIRTDSDIHISQSAKFKDLKIASNLDSSNIMGVDIEQFLSQSVKLDENEFVEDIYFKSIKCGDVFVGSVNSEEFPRDFVINEQISTSFGTKVFEKVNFDDLTVAGKVDSLKTADIVTKGGSQSIYGLKIFNSGLIIQGDLNIASNKLDGVDVDMLFKKPENELSGNHTIIFENSAIFSNLKVDGSVNGIELEEIAADLVYTDEDKVTIKGKRNFLGSVTVSESNLDFINDIPQPSFISTKKAHSDVSQKTFLSEVVFNNLNVKGLFDGTDITELFTNALYLNVANQTVSGKVKLESLEAGKIVILKSLNSRRIENLMSKNNEQKISANITLRSSTFKNIVCNEVILTEAATINNIDLSEHRRAFAQLSQVGDFLMVDGDVEVANIRVSLMNKHTTDSLFNLLRADKKNQNLNGNLVIERLIVEKSIIEESPSHGQLNVKQIIEGAIPLLTVETIYGDFIWEEIAVDKIKVGAMVNGFHLPTLLSNVVFAGMNSTPYIMGRKSFSKSIHIKGDLEASSVNGIDLGKSLLTRTTPQIISVPFFFDNIFAKDARLIALNGILVDDLKTVEKRDKVLINGSLNFQGHVHISSLATDGLIMGKNLSHILESAVLLNSKNVVGGPKHFRTSPKFNDLTIDHINNANLKKILGKRNWTDENFIMDSLRVHGTITSPKVSVAHLDVTDTIGKLTVNELENYATLGNSEHNKPSLTLNTATIHGAVKATQLNSNLATNFITRFSNQTVTETIFLSEATFTDVTLHNLNEIEIPQNISLNRDSVKTLAGHIFLNQPLKINGDLVIKGKVGEDKIEIPKDLIFLDQKSRIEGEVMFTSLLTTTNIKSSYSILNHMDLKALKYNLETMDRMELEIINDGDGGIVEEGDYIKRMKRIYLKECKRTSHLESLLSGALSMPRSLAYVYEHDFKSYQNPKNIYHKGLDVSPVTIFKAFYLVWMITALNPSSCNSDVYSFDQDAERFVYRYTLHGIGYIEQWIVLEERSDLVSLLAVDSGSGNCVVKGSSLWQLKSKNQILKKTQTLEIAVKGILEELPNGDKKLYLDADYETFIYIYSSEYLYKEGSTKKHLQFIRQIKDSSGGVVVARLWKGGVLEVEEWNKAERNSWDTPAVDIDDMALARYGDDLLILMSMSYIDLGGTKSNLWISRYESATISVQELLQIDGPTRILPYRVAEGRVHSTFIVLLSEHGSLKIYKPRGNPFLELWSEIPFELSRRVWSTGFSVSAKMTRRPVSESAPVASQKGIYLVFGDDQKMLVTKVQWNGRTLQYTNLTCILP